MRIWRVVLLLTAAAAMSACAASSRPAGEVKASSFLGSAIHKLKPGGADGASLIYLNPKAEWASYDKMLLDPVTFWRDSGETGEELSQQDKQMLADYFYAVIAKAMSTQVTLVSAPGPGVMRVQVAVTKADPSIVALDVVSTVLPQAIAMSAVKTALTGKPAFVGEACIAVKVTDSVSRKLLGAWVADRVGGKDLSAAQFDSWGDVEQAMRFWAAKAAHDLCNLQKKPDCGQPPKP
ncbi:MAG: DUF3313 domain-containing protein [Proteobacteria bacterium]|nr:DUF3313 domain-containing protein [Pseudomonadota bacterium]MBU1451000.1 DUF3313 domain-containing protein [Pseudomonadota bacterium]